MKVIEGLIREINKRRWERWRARQNKEREKSYFYCAPPPVTDTCEAYTNHINGDNYLYIYAVGRFDENRVSVSWQYQVCKCPPYYAWGYLTGTLKITVDGGSKTRSIDGVCSDDGTVTFVGLEESDHYFVEARIESQWQCSSPQDTFWTTFNRTIGCELSI